MKRSYFYLLITFFFWGSMYVVSKVAMTDIPPFTLTFYRQILAVSFMGLIAWKKGLKPIKREHWKYFLVIGILGYALNGSFQLTANTMMDASLASLFNSTNPLFIAFFAVVLLKENMTKNKVFGMICSFIGVFIILGVDGSSINLVGVMFSFVSVLFWSFCSVMIRKISKDYSSEQVTFVNALIGLPVLGILSWVELQTKTVILDPQAILAVVYMAVFCSLLTNLLWSASLKSLDASVCALFYPLQTFFAAILGILFLHEQLSVSFLVGGILISVGVVVGAFERKKGVLTT